MNRQEPEEATDYEERLLEEFLSDRRAEDADFLRGLELEEASGTTDPMGQLLSFTISQRGRRIALFCGYEYHFNRRVKDAIYWICSGRHDGCHARIVTDHEGRLKSIRNNQHNHVPHATNHGKFRSMTKPENSQAPNREKTRKKTPKCFLETPTFKFLKSLADHLQKESKNQSRCQIKEVLNR